MESTHRLTEQQQQWLTDVYQSHFRRVFRLCRRLLRNPDDAADAAHEVFLKAAGTYQLREGGREVGPWLLTVARNHCLDVLRRHERLGRVMVTLSPEGENSVNPEASVVEREVVSAILDRLRTRERRALWQSAVERRSVAAIAQDLRLSYMATAQLLHRAKRHAAMLAKGLAAILGLLELRRLARRAVSSGSRLASRVAGSEGLSFSARQLAAAAVLPLVVVVVSTSSTPRSPGILSPPAAGARVAGALPALPAGLGVPRAIDLVDERASTVGGILQQAQPGLSSTAKAAVNTVQGSANQLLGRVRSTTNAVTGLIDRRL